MTQPISVAEVAGPPCAAAELAVLLSTAARIEPALLRAMRLAALPSADVGAEADLWFSDRVATRSAEAVTLLPALLPELRLQLRERLRSAAPHDPIHQVWAVLDQVHAGLPPALRLEERVVRMWVTGDGGLADELSVAVRALVAEGREGIVDWFAGAWRRLPSDVRRTVPAWQLVQVAVHRRTLARHFAGAPTPDTLTTGDAAVVAGAVQDVELGVRRRGATLTFGETAARGLRMIQVPDTRPRVLDVIHPEGGRLDARAVVVHAGAITSVDVGTGPLRLRTARGDLYDLRPASTPWTARARRAAGRLPRPWRTALWPPDLRALVGRHEAAHPEADVELIVRAYRTAENIHRGQFRLSGETYLGHCVAVAGLLAELGMDSSAVAAGLLHSTAGHAGYPVDKLQADFGPAVAAVVEGVIRLDHSSSSAAARAETVRKLVSVMANEPRVLVVKLADQLENMRTVAVLSSPERKQRANEALDILVPLARRLGLGAIERELSDLAFRTLRPAEFETLRHLVAQTPDDDVMLAELRQGLSAARIRADVDWSPPHLYALHRNPARSGHAAETARAVPVIRVLVDGIADCYAALGVVHSLWRLIPGRFRDTVAVPEFRTARSLHTEVIGPSHRPAEVQIRSHAMHRDAECGVAALWHGQSVPDGRTDPATWLRQLVDWQQETAEPGDFPDGLRVEFGTPQISVFTAAGRAVTLPAGATPIDFAFAVSTDLGNECIAARVNGALVPLASALADGDRVEISVSPGSEPSPEWLAFVVTPRARTRIQHYRARARAEPPETRGDSAAAERMSVYTRPVHRDATSSVEVPGVDDAWITLGLCCTPVPNDDVFGFVTRSGGVRVHRTDCRDGQDLRESSPARIVEATWKPATTAPAFTVSVQVEALIGHRMFADVTRVLAEQGALIQGAKVTTSPGRVMLIRVVFEMAQPDRLGQLVAALRAIDGVYDAYRMTSGQ